MYTKTVCPYCDRAKALLKNKNASFIEINIEADMDDYQKLKEETGHMTVPQIFIGKKFVGGYTDLVALNEQGVLDGLLEALK